MIPPDDVGDLAERVLTFLHLCEEAKPHRRSVPLHHMDGAVLTDFDILGPDADPWLLTTQPGTPSFWPIDVATVCGATHKDWLPGTLQFTRIRTCSTAEARGMGAQLYGTRFVMWQGVMAEPDGKATTNSAVCCLHAGRWENASPHMAPKFSGYAARLVPFAVGMAASIQRQWTVGIGFGEGPRVRFVTDPAGARAVFRLRDLPPGASRRAALRHWVSAHARKAGQAHRDDPEARAWVHRHLRGAVDFLWSGMRCRIQPAEADLQAVEAERRAGALADV